jgi:NADP-dependent 3-hydroxy acid dehydrogenase YdfG
MSTPVTHPSLAGKAALVTGASSGAGEGIALGLARAGAHVALVARRMDRLEALAERIAAEGGTAFAVQADLARPDAAVAAVDAARARFGRLDVLVNDAGVMLNSPLEESRLADLERMIAINVTGLVAACHAAVPVMLAQGGGDIVNVSSIAARLANATSGVYSATKAAVSTFTEALRKEVTKRGVRVSVIEPGLIASELGEHIPHAGTRERFAKMTAAWTPLQPADLAAAVLYIVTQPRHVAVNSIVIRPAEQDL